MSGCIKNDPIKAASVSTSFSQSIQSVESLQETSITVSNGPAAQDLTKLFSQTASVVAAFSTKISQGSTNILTISNNWEEKDEALRRNNSGES